MNVIYSNVIHIVMVFEKNSKKNQTFFSSFLNITLSFLLLYLLTIYGETFYIM